MPRVPPLEMRSTALLVKVFLIRWQAFSVAMERVATATAPMGWTGEAERLGFHNRKSVETTMHDRRALTDQETNNLGTFLRILVTDSSETNRRPDHSKGCADFRVSRLRKLSLFASVYDPESIRNRIHGRTG